MTLWIVMFVRNNRKFGYDRITEKPDKYSIISNKHNWAKKLDKNKSIQQSFHLIEYFSKLLEFWDNIEILGTMPNQKLIYWQRVLILRLLFLSFVVIWWYFNILSPDNYYSIVFWRKDISIPSINSKYSIVFW